MHSGRSKKRKGANPVFLTGLCSRSAHFFINRPQVLPGMQAFRAKSGGEPLWKGLFEPFFHRVSSDLFLRFIWPFWGAQLHFLRTLRPTFSIPWIFRGISIWGLSNRVSGTIQNFLRVGPDNCHFLLSFYRRPLRPAKSELSSHLIGHVWHCHWQPFR